MARKQVSVQLTDIQIEWLKATSRLQDRTISYIVSMCIDAMRLAPKPNETETTYKVIDNE